MITPVFIAVSGSKSVPSLAPALQIPMAGSETRHGLPFGIGSRAVRGGRNRTRQAQEGGFGLENGWCGWNRVEMGWYVQADREIERNGLLGKHGRATMI